MNPLKRKMQQIQIVYSLAERQESEMAKNFAAAQQLFEKEKRYLNMLNDYRLQYGNELNQNRSANPTWFISGYYHFIQHIDLSIEKQNKKIQDCEKSVNEAKIKWNEAHLKLGAIQNLLTGLHKKQDLHLARQEQKILDDFVTLMRFRED